MLKAKWFKGNLHCHTTESDGNATPEFVTRWYRRHGYDFLVLSDHNHLTLLEYGAGKRRFKRPLMIPGEEISAQIMGGTVPIHINGIGISRVLEPIDAGGVLPTIQANVNAILGAGGIASINHPNFHWAFGHEEIKQVTGASLLEIFNAHPATNTWGGSGRPSHVEIWDRVLSADRVIFGVATDDSHQYTDFTPAMDNPGRGWVVVRAKELSQEAIVEGLASGDFYSSTGVMLTDLELSPDILRVKVRTEGDKVYGVKFTGRDGAILAESVVFGPLFGPSGEDTPGPPWDRGTSESEATYRPRGDEGYVRATVSAPDGYHAWTQPVFLP